MYEYPFGNGQQLNLDWFLSEWKNLLAAWEAEKNGVEGALQAEIDRAEAALADVFAARDAAAQSAANALESKNAAAQSASDASGYLATVRADANTASNAAQTAADSAQTALASKNNAANSERNAAQSEQNALGYKNAAAQSAEDAQTAEQNVQDTIESATEQAVATATQSANDAANRAGQSASAAAQSEANALQSKNAAAQSAENAEDAAASVEASAQQITTNTNDISDLKESIIDEINIPLTGIVNNKYITDTGILGNSNGWSATQNFISCEGYDQLVFDCNDYSRSSIYNAWYRASSQDTASYISNFTLSQGTITIDVPNGAKFFRVSTLTADLATLTVKGIRSIGTQIEQLNNKLIAPQYLKVLQWNVGLFNDGSTRIPTAQANSQIAKLKKTIGIINADIFNAQETERFFDADLTIESNSIMTFKYPAKVGTFSLVSYLKQATNNPIFKWFDADNTRGFWYYDLNIGSYTITIINTHLSADTDSTIHRDAEIAELISFMNTKDRVILTGDFNVYSDSEYTLFTNAGYTLCNGGSFGWFKTWPVNISGSDWGSEHLDNIICSANIIPQLVETVETPISDHAPLVATFMLT